jgi:hypothetical protein
VPYGAEYRPELGDSMTQVHPQGLVRFTASQVYEGPSDPRMGLSGVDPRMGIGSSQTPNGMYSRNLIGSIAASANRLTDPDDRIGIWFVLQDLSVRTEGAFR